jgi:AraC-like DNA-binding protein
MAIELPWWEQAAPVIHTAGNGLQTWKWDDPLRILHDHELFLVGRGFHGSIISNSTELNLDGPAWALVPSNVPHTCRGEATGKKRCWIHFDWFPTSHTLNSLFTYGTKVDMKDISPAPKWAPSIFTSGKLHDDSLIEMQYELTRFWSRGGALGAVRARSLLLEILVKILVVDTKDNETPIRALAERVRECLDRIAVLPVSQTPSLPKALQDIGRGSDHLTRIFRSTFGITPVRYILEQRIGRACLLLRNGKPLTAVAMELGFSDSAYLSRLVRRISNHPPRWHMYQDRMKY